MSDYDTLSTKLELETCYEGLWYNLKILYSFPFPNHKRLYKTKQLQYVNDLYESNTIDEFLKDELVTALSMYPTVTITKVKEKGIEQSNKDVEYLNIVIRELVDLIDEIDKDDHDRFINSLTK